MIDPTARARIDRWKASLLDLSAGNRLLDQRAAATLVELPGVDARRLQALLAAGAELSIEAGTSTGAAVEAGRLRAPLADAILSKRLAAMRRAARAQLADGGVHALWLGLGALTWLDADGEAHSAPLALWPVELERTGGGGLRLVPSASVEPRVNQTLGEKLRREFEIVLPDDTDDVAALVDAAAAVCVTRPGWRADASTTLGIFSFAKFVMWTDLDARADELLASPVVAHLASGAGVAFGQPSAEAAGALFAPPAHDLLAPLDADASQLAAIGAAGAGASFVLQGPPGTGKSQTIANLVVHCVAQGKSVLVVADKIAALEVVQQRLAAVGLGDFVLELHSHKANRAQVLARLGRVLERAFRPGAVAGSDARLAELRASLDGVAANLHRVGPFGRSLHEVVGRLVELRAAPRADLADGDAIALDRATFDRRKLAVAQLAAAAIPVEPAATHPWRASSLTRWPLDGRERALSALGEAQAAATELADAVREVTALVPGLVGRTRDQLRSLGTLAALAATSPRPGVELLVQVRPSRGDDIAESIALVRARGGGSLEVPRDPGAFLVLASRHRALAAEVSDRFRVDATEFVALDPRAAWAQLRKWGGSVAPLRFVALRGVRADVRAAAIPGLLDTDEAMLAALETAIAEAACRAALLAAAEPAKRWFGELARSADDLLAMDLGAIDAAVGWAAELRKAFDAVDVAGGEPGRLAAWRALVAQVAATPGEPTELAPFAHLAAAAARWEPALAALADATGLDANALGAGDDHLQALRERAEVLAHAVDGMRDWVAFHGARQAALAAGASRAASAIERGDLGASELADACERATLLAWADAEISELPALAHFHGPTHHAHVSAFADLDRAALALVRARALVKLAERVPRATKGPGAFAAEPGGEVGALLHELKKQRGHRPLRALFAEIPSLLPKLAPCVLMSPLSVAQYLDPALPKFDVVVFDEASQLPTADAIGALARGESAVIVGDSKQLPPTRFFESAPISDEELEAGADADLESILDECVAARLPELSLAWHYRSRHEDLIAFANAHYYGDRLQVFPSAHGGSDLGVAWRRVDGVYGRAGARTNPIEAEAIVAEVLARLRDPAQRARSIGVVTFSTAQRELIEDLLDDARVADPGLDAFFEAESEPVLVRNLEAMQGDERDVILLSVGYGPDASGALSLNFGPLSQRGGERRLNVAITRAREQLVVFSSFDPEALADAGAAGVRDLGALIAFARGRGGAGHAHADEPASPVTAAIARALAERGWTVRHQVGCGAYKVDLAVVDPGDPSRYVLAIEHDGASYASAPAARDRDRLRAQVLGALGWRLHRIWSLDWWADSDREVVRAHGAIVAALAAARQRRGNTGPVALPAQKSGRVRTTTTRQPAIAAGSGATEAAGSAAVASAAGDVGASGGASDATVPNATGANASRPNAAGTNAAGPNVTGPSVTGSNVAGLNAAGTNAAGPNVTGPSVTGSNVAGASGPVTGGPHMILGKGSAPVKLARGQIAIGPYAAAAIPAGRRAPDDLFAPRYLAELGKIVEQVLAAEAPMHVDLLARRVGAYFGIGRVTQRVSEQVRGALVGRGRLGDEPDMVWRMDQDPASVPAVRVAGNLASGKRDIDEVPLAELAAAARLVVERAVGIAPSDLVRDTARLLGFSRLTEKVTTRIDTGVRLAAHRELIAISPQRVTLPD